MSKHIAKAVARAMAIANGHDKPDEYADKVAEAYKDPQAQEEIKPADDFKWPDPNPVDVEDHNPSMAEDLKASVKSARDERANEDG